MKNNKLAILLRGIISENPVLILILGTCPTLANTTSMFQAVSMGFAATAVLICSNFVISLLRNVIPDTVRIPCYIVVIASFVTAVSMLLNAYLFPVYKILGSWLALITVNCIVLGRAEMYARKNNPLNSAIDGLGMGLGFLLALFVMSTIREMLGAGTIFSGMQSFGIEPIQIPIIYDLRIPFLVESSGGFLVYGLLIAVMSKITEKKGGLKRKDFSCEGCPSAHLCNKTSCPENMEISAAARGENDENTVEGVSDNA
jgi:electron transport complex protein RnfE